jgi:hypothetical protein
MWGPTTDPVFTYNQEARPQNTACTLKWSNLMQGMQDYLLPGGVCRGVGLG